MSITLNNPAIASTTSPNFKGSVRETEKGNKYYHSHAGLTIASGFAGLCAISAASGLFSSSVAKELPKEVQPIIRNAGKASIISGLIGMAIHLGCGSIIDNMRNKEARENADTGTTFITTGDGIQRPYVQLKTGSKKGAILGAIAGGIDLLVSTMFVRRRSFSQTILSVGFSALGGWLLGKWSDSIANNKSNKNLSITV